MSIERHSVEDSLFLPIPIEVSSVNGWQEIPIQECREPLVPIGICSQHPEIFTNSFYHAEHSDSPYSEEHQIKGSLLTCFVRQGAAEQLLAAQRMLPPHHRFVVYDTYRPLQVQQSLFDHYIKALAELYPNLENDTLIQETQKYVSLPSVNAVRPSPHNTGGAVDLAIMKVPEDISRTIETIDTQVETEHITNLERYQAQMEIQYLLTTNGQLLNFGTPFDYGGTEASVNHFELVAQQRNLNPEEHEILLNRRLLYNVMRHAGFEPYADEWWHFNAKKSQMGAKSAGLPYATYGAQSLSEDNQRHEHMRKKYTRRLARMNGGYTINRTIEPTLQHAISIFESISAQVGDTHDISLPKGVIISPNQ